MILRYKKIIATLLNFYEKSTKELKLPKNFNDIIIFSIWEVIKMGGSFDKDKKAKPRKNSIRLVVMGKIYPNDAWENATEAGIVIDEIGFETKTPIPIERIRWTPAWVTVRSEQFPMGVVILNEADPDNSENREPINLPVIPSIEDEIKNVTICKNSTWPTGVATLFLDRESFNRLWDLYLDDDYGIKKKLK